MGINDKSQEKNDLNRDSYFKQVSSFEILSCIHLNDHLKLQND